MTRARPLQRLTDDEGSSLLELLVGIAITAVFGAMFSGAIFMMTNSTKTAQSITTSSTQLSTAFTKLDKTVRFAAALSPPGRSTGSLGPVSWYAEFRTTNTGAEVCTQLRVDQATQQLQSRTWTVVAGVGTGATGWTILAQGIVNGDVTDPTADRPVPFVLVPTSGSARYPSLTVGLVATSGDASTTSMSLTTYPAVNATTTTSTSGVCQEMGRP
ncbi:hypothetical protein V3N99_01080 [Dermatophilaceae bacterium Soc4.6]